MEAISWLKQKVSGFDSLSVSERKAIKDFALLWSLFEGRVLNFDAKAVTIIQAVNRLRDGDKITISDLLKMRSGLYNYTSAPELGESLDRDPTRVWTPQELLAIAFTRPTIFAPGKEYDYCNTNYALRAHRRKT
jgi:D-alanyl-D-alanine carboxypeptidase